MPANCPALLPLPRFTCGKHSAPRRTPFRSSNKKCSLSQRNGVRLQTGMLFGNHNGIVFAFRPESRSPSTGFPTRGSHPGNAGLTMEHEQEEPSMQLAGRPANPLLRNTIATLLIRSYHSRMNLRSGDKMIIIKMGREAAR
jgi:hypothetical protein